jgi:hypothetical protein
MSKHVQSVVILRLYGHNKYTAACCLEICVPVYTCCTGQCPVASLKLMEIRSARARPSPE